MIKSLQIKNYALIEELEMHPSSMLNIITGETGAGKSIMLGAVGLLLGNRADTKILLNENEKCIVEGTFDLSAYQLESVFNEEDLDYESECVIRREISASGKSRAFINDSPANLNSLKRIGTYLMDVHSQHQSLDLGSNSYQMNVLDAFAGHTDLIKGYEQSFSSYSQYKKKYDTLVDLSKKGAEDADYKKFILQELTQAQLDDLDQEALEKELETLENAEEIKLKLSQSIHLLDESEYSVLEQLKEVRQATSAIRSFSSAIDELANRVESASIELQDVLNELNIQQDKIEHNPERTQELKERLDLLYRLQKKHQLQSVEELIKFRDDMDESLSKISNLDEEIATARADLEQSEKEMLDAGTKLSESRKLYALNFSDEIEKIIKGVGIENGAIEIQVKKSTPTREGLDMVEMLFSANKGIRPQELKEVASGGEFSRLIFAIKYLIADKTSLPTIIFDEIDTGVSGQVALQMIGMMKEMAKNHQVISISHLPQFAAGGDAHYFVYKDHSSNRSVSKIKKLKQEDRVLEIAKMIGGENPASSAMESARELLQIG
ncbi:MAG: DNA repair protein RecN [Bacteroidota bacterium]